MSLQECYDRDQANCTRIDNSCVLEYNPDGENPTCVPAMANMFPVALGDRPKLSDSDLRTIQRVLMRLLPPGNAVHGANVLDQAIQGLFVHLRPRVDWKISKLLSGENYSSWADVVLNISREVIAEINESNETMCSICLTNLNEPPAEGVEATIVQCQQCSAMYHSRCLRQWVSTRDTCPNCRANVPVIASEQRHLREEERYQQAADHQQAMRQRRDLQLQMIALTRERTRLADQPHQQQQLRDVDLQLVALRTEQSRLTEQSLAAYRTNATRRERQLEDIRRNIRLFREAEAANTPPLRSASALLIPHEQHVITKLIDDIQRQTNEQSRSGMFVYRYYCHPVPDTRHVRNRGGTCSYARG